MTAESAGFGVIPCFIGHGIGTYFHGLPDIFPVGKYQPRITETPRPLIMDLKLCVCVWGGGGGGLVN